MSIVLPIASLFDVAADIGYPLIFVIVLLETGCGIPFAPGELALVSGAIGAAEGKLSIGWVIAVAAAGAIIGDNIGYTIGKLGGRRLLERDGLFAKQRRGVLAMADPFFDRHGPKTVFIGRWLPVLRVYASWLAGASRMPYGAFLFWNATGGVVWATAVGLLGYFGGSAASSLIEKFGKFGAVFVLLGVVTVVLITRRQQRRGEDWVRKESQEIRALRESQEMAALSETEETQPSAAE
jgi:membrane protein DedA with SNARE-associated domain